MKNYVKYSGLFAVVAGVWYWMVSNTCPPQLAQQWSLLSYIYRSWMTFKSITIANLFFSQAYWLCMVVIVVAVLALFFRSKVRFIFPILFFFCCFFFRNPDRDYPQELHDKYVLISPADGHVVGVEKVIDNPLFSTKIAIFLSPLDVHVQWAPCDGVVQEVTYHPGLFAMAFLPKSSALNERNDIVLKTETGKILQIRQIAGTIARTIVCWVSPEQELSSGQKCGMIKFGSRVELFVPAHTDIFVKPGDRVFGGHTIVGRM